MPEFEIQFSELFARDASTIHLGDGLYGVVEIAAFAKLNIHLHAH